MPPETTKERVDKLEKSVDDITCALRGSGDEPGIIGRLTTLEKMFQRFIDNDFPHMKDELMNKISETKAALEKKDTEDTDRLRLERQLLLKDTISWRPILKEFIAPIIVGIITAVLISGIIDRVLK